MSVLLYCFEIALILLNHHATSPASQPYNNVDLDTQLRFANVSNSTATVHVSIGGVEMDGSPFTLASGASTRKSFTGVNNGPVQIVSDVDIVAAERVIYKVNNLPTIYWLPWYNNIDIDTQLRFGVP